MDNKERIEELRKVIDDKIQQINSVLRELSKIEEEEKRKKSNTTYLEFLKEKSFYQKAINIESWENLEIDKFTYFMNDKDKMINFDIVQGIRNAGQVYFLNIEDAYNYVVKYKEFICAEFGYEADIIKVENVIKQTKNSEMSIDDVQ